MTQLSKLEVGDMFESRRSKRLLPKIELFEKSHNSILHTDTVTEGSNLRDVINECPISCKTLVKNCCFDVNFCLMNLKEVIT